MKPSGQAYQKLLNMSRLMRSIRLYPGRSRTDLAHYTSLTKSTVSNLVRDLMARGLLRETASPPEELGMGRPPVGLEIDGRRLLIGGVELRPEGWTAALTDLHGRRRRLLHSRVSASNGVSGLASAGGSSEISGLMASAAEALHEELRGDMEERLLGIGVALPATVDPFRNRILVSESFGLHDLPFRSLCTLPEDLPLLIENDANALAWGALARNSGGDHDAAQPRNLLAVTARRSRESVPTSAGTDHAARGLLRVGTGLVINGEVHYSHDFSAGEFRSVAWRSGMPGEIGHTEDPLFELFASLSTPVSMLRPAALVYGGDLCHWSDRIFELLDGELAGRFIDPRVSGCPVEPAVEGEDAAAVGAAHMVRERLFALPTLDEPRPEELPHWLDVPVPSDIETDDSDNSTAVAGRSGT